MFNSIRRWVRINVSQRSEDCIRLKPYVDFRAPADKSIQINDCYFEASPTKRLLSRHETRGYTNPPICVTHATCPRKPQCTTDCWSRWYRESDATLANLSQDELRRAVEDELNRLTD